MLGFFPLLGGRAEFLTSFEVYRYAGRHSGKTAWLRSAQLPLEVTLQGTKARKQRHLASAQGSVRSQVPKMAYKLVRRRFCRC